MTGGTREIAYTRGPAGSLVLKCDAPGKPVYVDFVSKEFLGGDGLQRGIREFLYRFDDAPAIASWFKYDDNDAWSFRKQDVEAFAASLPTAKRVRIRATTYRGEIIDAEFSTAGAGAAIDRAMMTCAKPAPVKHKKTLGVHIG